MTKYNVGDVVSVEFPFSDLQTKKRRPGLVLDRSDVDLLVAHAEPLMKSNFLSVSVQLGM